MNEAGQVVGVSPPSGLYQRAFLWDGEALRELGTLGGTSSRANAINAAGFVVGNSRNEEGLMRPFFWDGTQMYDLNELIDPDDPALAYVTLTEAMDINDRGDIAALGVDSRTRASHAYLLSVVMRLAGFDSPVDMPPLLNDAQAGRTIPLRFSVSSPLGVPVDDLENVQLRVVAKACDDLAVSADPVDQYVSGADQLLSLGSGRYQYNWKTTKEMNGCREITLSLEDRFSATPTVLRAWFRFRS